MPLCAEVSDIARRIGCVNTLVRKPEGWVGYNTDYDGFCYMLKEAGIDPAGRKALVFGNGGASLTARTALKDLGASDIIIISRRLPEKNDVQADTYDRLFRYSDAEIVINTTPVGMYPRNGEKPADLRMFPECMSVADVIFNPSRTALLLQAAYGRTRHAYGAGPAERRAVAGKQDRG